MLQTLLQPHGLEHQDLLAALLPVLPASRNKGRRIDPPGKTRLPHFKMEGDLLILLLAAARKGGHFPSLGAQTPDIDVGADHLVGEPPGLGQQHAIFGDQAMPAKHQVRRRFSLAGAGIQVAADKPCGLPRHQVCAVIHLSGDLIAGRQVYDQRGPRQGMGDAGRIRNPQVLADLRSHRQALQLLAHKELVHAKGHGAALIVHPLHLPASRLKMPCLIKFPVIRQAVLWHNAEQMASCDRRRRIVELSSLFPGKPHKKQPVLLPGMKNNLVQDMPGLLHQQILPEEVFAGIARQAKFREHHDLCPGLHGPVHPQADLGRVMDAVCHPYIRRYRRHLDKPIKHISFLLSRLLPTGCVSGSSLNPPR